ncbi:MAG: hypothetical protein GW913_02210 [Myxococcales bacterium]|nr:hypothetical protein [Myxococcales bacterium]
MATPRAGRRLLPAVFVTLALGCSGGSGSPGTDSGTIRDTGTGVDTGMTGSCGRLGNFCCSATPHCDSDMSCGREGTCCLNATGSCGSVDDCCGRLDCVAGSCCAPSGGSCTTADQCCGEMICNGGFCELPAAGCGHRGEACCEGDGCLSGFTCAGGGCIACGGDSEPCCRPPSACDDGFVCGMGRCTAAVDCGGDGQTCCAGDVCTGALACEAGVCTTATPPPPPPTECGYATCGECTANYPCGFCGDTGSCMVGSGTGPDTGSCTDWKWLESDCTVAPPPPPTCTASTCDGCVGSTGCGFCGDTGSCAAGSSTGPSAGSCTDWKWLALDCAPPPTCVHSDCGSCTGEYPCGFCGDTSSCQAGSSAGPDTGSCTDWKWLVSECTAPDPCVGASTCGGCTDILECGYCASTSSCVVGGPTGPSTGSCADWIYTGSECTCAPVTSSCTAAADCCTGLSCRAGATFGARCCVEAAASCTTGADCCGYMDCVGGTCACRVAGRACLDTGDCCSGTCTAGRCG